MGVLFSAYLLIISLYALYSTASALGGYKDVREAKRFKGKVLIIVPCRGIDKTLGKDLVAFKNQSYSNYDIIAVVDTKEDPALSVIKKCGIRYTITSRRFDKGSGKVNAIATALDRFSNYDAYVIADSDIYVRSDWLSRLVAPLSDKGVGASTSFPYFMATYGFWSRVKTVWGFVGQGMMESTALRFGWGGSLAFRKDLLGKDDFELFRKAISDDMAITKAVKRKGLGIRYVKGAQPIVFSDDNFLMFSEWSNRQTALSISAMPSNFWLGLVSYSMSFILFVSAVALSIYYSLFALLFFVPLALQALKTHRRLQQSCPEFIFINTIMPLIYIVNLLFARSMKNIEWRGRSYSIR